MALIQVHHTVPVMVEVNTDTGKVERVVMLQEHAEPVADRTEHRDVTVGDADYPVAADADVTAALAIVADIDVVWPEWESGY